MYKLQIELTVKRREGRAESPPNKRCQEFSIALISIRSKYRSRVDFGFCLHGEIDDRCGWNRD